MTEQTLQETLKIYHEQKREYMCATVVPIKSHDFEGDLQKILRYYADGRSTENIESIWEKETKENSDTGIVPFSDHHFKPNPTLYW